VIRISVEVRSRDGRFRMLIRAETIERAVSLAELRYPHSEVSVVFPIAAEIFFCEREALEAEKIRLQMPEEVAG
jgi:hypothetical protein